MHVSNKFIRASIIRVNFPTILVVDRGERCAGSGSYRNGSKIKFSDTKRIFWIYSQSQ